jgi:hypothetical protein
MAQMTELKHEEKTRRRTTSTVAVLGVTLAVAATGWFAVSQLGGGRSTSPADPAPTPTAASLEAGLRVGNRLEPKLVARAPDSWEVPADERYVWMDSDGDPYGPTVQIGGPVVKVWDTYRDRPGLLSIGGCFSMMGGCFSYAEYLRSHPALDLLDERVVTVDGRQFVQLTFEVKADAPDTPGYDGVILGKFDGIDTGQAWDEVEQGTVFTETVIELAPGRVDNPTMVVKAAGADAESELTEQAAALDLVLSTMKLPD